MNTQELMFEAVLGLLASGQPVNPNRIASTAGISRSLVYYYINKHKEKNQI